jgi:hypothetical protein
MTIQRITNSLIYCLQADTKPTTYADHTIAYEVDSGNVFVSTSGVWSLLRGAAKTETLQNKSISGSSNTLTNIPSSALPATTVYTGQANTFGAFNQTFPSGKLLVLNPAGTFSYALTGAALAASRVLNLPLLTGADQVTCDNFATTLTNKTISSASNTLTLNASSGTLTDTSAAVGDILAVNSGTKFTRLGIGSTGQVLTAGASTVGWATPPPGGTGINSVYQFMPDSGIYGTMVADVTAFTTGERLARVTTTGTYVGVPNLAGSEGNYGTWTTTSTAGSASGYHDAQVSAWVSPNTNPILRFRSMLGTITNTNFIYGFAGNAIPTTTTLVSTGTAAAAFGYRSTPDTNMMCITNAGSGGAATYTNSGVALSTLTGAFHTYEIDVTLANVVFSIDGSVVATVSSNIPTTSVGMFFVLGVSNIATGVATHSVKYCEYYSAT